MKNSNTLIYLLICLSSTLAALHAHPSSGLPTIVSRASDSISALLASGSRNSSPNSAQVQPTVPATPQQAPVSFGTTQQTSAPPNSSAAISPLNLQAHLSAMQTQAQRQISQLNGLVLSGANQLVNSPLAAHAVNLTGGANKYSNVLEVLSNVGRAIQNQIMSGGSGNQIQIITSLSSSSIGGESANNKKNEYQSIVATENQQLNLAKASGANQSVGDSNSTASVTNGSPNYREQGEQLRQEIVRRVGQLQQVVATSMDVLKNNGDLIVRRLLEQLNSRLDQAKSKADKIINEPATNEMAIKALTTINQGLNNLNNIITNIVNRLDINSKDVSAQLAGARSAFGPTSGGTILDPNRLRLNFHQLGQQFSSAISAVQQQQRQMPSQQQQPQQPGAGSQTNVASSNLRLSK